MTRIQVHCVLFDQVTLCVFVLLMLVDYKCVDSLGPRNTFILTIFLDRLLSYYYLYF